MIGRKILFTTKQGWTKLVDGSQFNVGKRTTAATKLSENDVVIDVSITDAYFGSEDSLMSGALSGGSDDMDGQMVMTDLLSGNGSEETAEMSEGIQSNQMVVLQTEKGQFLRFYLKEIPEKKKNAIGVIGIRLNEGDAVSNVYVLDAGDNYKVEYNDRVIELRKVKTARRGTKGTKVRGGKSDS